MFNFNHLGIEYKESETQYPLKKKKKPHPPLQTILADFRETGPALPLQSSLGQIFCWWL